MPPVVAAIGAGVAAITPAILGKAALQIGVSLALGAVSNSIAKKKAAKDARGLAQIDSVQAQARNVSVRQAADHRDLVYGQVRKGGNIVYMNQYDGFVGDRKANYFHMVIVVAGHPVQSIDTVYFDGIPAIDASGAALGKWVSHVGPFEKALGTQVTNPFPQLASAVVNWGPDHILMGCAAVALRIDLDQAVFPNGIPAISFDVRGKNDILDPRTGLRGYSYNSALCVADFMAMPERLGGMGATIGADTGINSAALIEAANICDELVPIIGEASLIEQLMGGQEPRYTANGYMKLDVGRRDVIEALLTSMAGSAVYRGSQWYILAGAYRAPEISIGPDDLDDGSIVIHTRRSARENANAARGTFISPKNDWQVDDWPAYKSETYIAEDGGKEKWLDLQLPFTKSASTAQRLAKIAIERIRRQISVSFSGKLPLFKATAGDTIKFNFPFAGFDEKPFEVNSVSFSGEGNNGARLELVLSETSPLVYDWNASEAQIYAAAPRTNLPSAFDILPPTNLRIDETLYAAAIGQGVRARVIFSWDESPSINATQYDVQFKLASNATWMPPIVTAGNFVQLDDFPNGTYDFRVRAKTRLGAASGFVSVQRIVYGLTSPPLQLADMSIHSLSGIAFIQWTQSTDLDVLIGGDILVAHSSAPAPTWGNASIIRKVAGSDNGVGVELMQGTYFIRARDSTGNLGPVSFVFSSAATALPFSPLGFLQEDDEFSGVKDGTAELGGALILTGDDDIYSHVDIYPVPDLWTGGNILSGGVYNFSSVLDLGALKSVRVRREVEFEGFVLDDNIYAVENIWDANIDIYGTDPNTDVVVQISITNDNPSGSPIWSDWTPVMVSEVRARGIRARAILTTINPRATPRVTKLRLYTEEVIV